MVWYGMVEACAGWMATEAPALPLRPTRPKPVASKGVQRGSTAAVQFSLGYCPTKTLVEVAMNSNEMHYTFCGQLQRIQNDKIKIKTKRRATALL